ncbi:MAG: GAF domain-containing protein, partial [Thermodesulfobacteriota bacterium]
MMRQEKREPKRKDIKPAYTLIITVLSIFVVEALIMRFLPLLSHKFILYEAIADALLLTIVILPVLYLLLFRPMVSYIKAHELAEDGLRESHRELERRVEECTAEMNAANQVLQREIARRVQVEKSLRKSQARHQEAQRIARLGHWELDLMKDELLWSDEIYRLFEMDPKKFGASYEAFLDIIHPDDREYVNSAYTESVKNRTPYNIVHRLKMKDGTIKYVHERCETVYDEEGKPLRSIGTVQDVTERKETEEQSVRQEHVLKTLHALHTRYNVGERELCNEVVKAMADYFEAPFATVEHLSGPDLEIISMWEHGTLVGGMHIPLAGTPCEKVKETHDICWYQGNLREQYPNDPFFQQYPVRSYVGSPIFNGAGRVVGIINVMYEAPRSLSEKDIQIIQLFGQTVGAFMERKRSEEMLSRNQKELQAFTHASRILISAKSVDEILRTVCGAAQAVFDLRLAWIGLLEEGSSAIKPVATCGPAEAYASEITVRWDDSPEGRGPSGKAIRTGMFQVQNDIEGDAHYSPWREKAVRYGFRSSMAVPLICAEKKTTGVVNLYSNEPDFFTVERGRMVQGFANQAAIAIENVRLLEGLEEKVAERTEELSLASDAAQAANRAKSAFLANMSHELRTPLNSIIGFSEILSKGIAGGLTEEQGEYITDILDSSQHLLSLIDDILDLSKIESEKVELQMSECGVKELLEGSARMVREMALKHHISLTTGIEEGIGEITADGRRIRQVVYNLLSNAVKFTPDGGEVSLQARRLKSGESKELDAYPLPATVPDGEYIE